MNVQVYVHQADVMLAEGTDPAAVGAMVTVAAGRATGASTTAALTVIRGLFPALLRFASVDYELQVLFVFVADEFHQLRIERK